MAVEKGIHDDFGKKRKYVAIDLADTKHKNRVLTFFRRKHPVTGKTYYDVRAQWTADKFHPFMMLSKKDLLELSVALEEMALSKCKSK